MYQARRTTHAKALGRARAGHIQGPQKPVWGEVKLMVQSLLERLCSLSGSGKPVERHWNVLQQWRCSLSALSSTVATALVWLLNTGNTASATEEPNFAF